MANPWFRLYSEFATDPKVQMLSEAMQRRLTMILCLRCSNTLVTLHEDEIAFQLRISETELAETKALFISKGFIDKQWNVLNWEKRQFASDSSAARVAKHRALQKEKQQQACNVTEEKSNALEQNRTDTDTDTDKKAKTASAVEFDSFYSAYPKKVGKPAAEKAWKAAKVKPAELVNILADIATRSQSTDWLKDGGQFIPNPSTYLNQRRWEDVQPATAQVSSAFAGGI